MRFGEKLLWRLTVGCVVVVRRRESINLSAGLGAD